ncbi:WW domain [Phytophthora cinnamomi]|uniref:WW domain n=1 Tax=Phytophthora cinnamomi TaxID=4785 RepID=UPI00355AC456|nr:WW domain [Phytophthora cinnamomi]
MGRRAREEGGWGCSDGDWGWRTFLEKLHFFLDNETEGDSLAWLEDGVRFVVHQASEARLETWLGLRGCSLHQVLEALNFHCRQELHWEHAIYRHDCFVRGNPLKIDEMLVGRDSSGLVGKEVADMAMPSVAYSSALKPLEVRLSLSDSHSQSWEVTIAPSVLPHPNFDGVEFFHFEESVGAGSSAEENSWEDMLDNSDQWSDHDLNSPMWWSQRSDFSSICTDDLSDMESLSQLSTYYG